MKLYFSPGACSLSPHIALTEAGLTFEAERVDLASKKTASGADYNAINAKGYVPALQLDNGQVLTENIAIVQYIADQVPATNLAPAYGTMERYKLMEWLGFLNSEVHKGFSPLFNRNAAEGVHDAARQVLARRFDFLEQSLAGRNFLTGNTFTVADGYLFTILRWTDFVKIDLAKWPNLQAFLKRVAERPAVRTAMLAEGLIKG